MKSGQELGEALRQGGHCSTDSNETCCSYTEEWRRKRSRDSERVKLLIYGHYLLFVSRMKALSKYEEVAGPSKVSHRAVLGGRPMHWVQRLHRIQDDHAYIVLHVSASANWNEDVG